MRGVVPRFELVEGGHQAVNGLFDLGNVLTLHNPLPGCDALGKPSLKLAEPCDPALADTRRGALPSCSSFQQWRPQ
jgi:hypothetical protein